LLQDGRGLYGILFCCLKQTRRDLTISHVPIIVYDIVCCEYNILTFRFVFLSGLSRAIVAAFIVCASVKAIYCCCCCCCYKNCLWYNLCCVGILTHH